MFGLKKMTKRKKRKKIIVEIKGTLEEDDDNYIINIPDISSAKKIKFKLIEEW